MSEKKKRTALILAILLAGIHRFYVGKPASAILFIITVGGVGVWWILDIISIAKGTFTDAEGKTLA